MKDIINSKIIADTQKLNIMYQGDKDRDAKPTIRGFLFQDFVAIEYLLDESTLCLCSEFLEDIDVFDNNGNIKVIQAKYYPKTSPKMNEILTDLYYQYLTMKLLECELECKPILYLARKAKLRKRNIEKMKELVGDFDKPKTVLNADKFAEWLKENINTKEKHAPQKAGKEVIQEQGVQKEAGKEAIQEQGIQKEAEKEAIQEKSVQKEAEKEAIQEKGVQKKDEKSKDASKKILFENFSSNAQLEKFLEVFETKQIEPDIQQFRKHIMEGLNQKITGGIWKGDERDNILLGLAVSYIQNKYLEDVSELEKVIIQRDDFIQYLIKQINEKDESCISAYLLGHIRQIYADILYENDNLQKEKAEKLQKLVKNTEKWICSFVSNIEGQYQLLNTISSESKKEVKEFRKLDIESRLLKIASEKEGFKTFLRYLWKIILDINADNKEQDDLLKVEPYIDSSITDYICVKFNKDVEAGIILTSISNGTPKSCFQKIHSRMFQEKQRPKKLYLAGPFKGMYDYERNITEVYEHSPITNPVDRDYYIIECMQCIGIDINDWNQLEKCENCIFQQNCAKEKNQ